MRWAGHVGQERKLYKACFVGKSRKKETTRKTRKDGIRMDLGEIDLGVCGLDSTGSG
jgi:hypothetical protein